MLLLSSFLNMADMSEFQFLATGKFYFGGIGCSCLRYSRCNNWPVFILERSYSLGV